MKNQGWKGERQRHSMAARGITTTPDVILKQKPSGLWSYILKINGEEFWRDRNITTKSAAIEQAFENFIGQTAITATGEVAGEAIAFGTAEQLVKQGYDSTGMMMEGIQTKMYDMFDTTDEVANLPAVVVEQDGNEYVYVIDYGGIVSFESKR